MVARAIPVQPDYRVYRVRKARRVITVPRVLPERTVTTAARAQPALQVYRVCRAYKACRVLQVPPVLQAAMAQTE